MVDIQLDLETLGTEAGDVVIAIGALEFYPRGQMLPMTPTLPRPANSFYRNIDVFSSLMIGLKIKDNTIEWWQKQRDTAQAALTVKPVYLVEAVDDFNAWFKALDKDGNVNVWAKSPSFDCAVWEAACKAVGLSVPWDFRNLRDVRTIVAVAGIDEKKVANSGVKHNALDDCAFQARVVQEAYKAIVVQPKQIPTQAPAMPGYNPEPTFMRPPQSPAPEPLSEGEKRGIIARLNRD